LSGEHLECGGKVRHSITSERRQTTRQLANETDSEQLD